MFDETGGWPTNIYMILVINTGNIARNMRTSGMELDIYWNDQALDMIEVSHTSFSQHFRSRKQTWCPSFVMLPSGYVKIAIENHHL